jgi:hypothetical protein
MRTKLRLTVGANGWRSFVLRGVDLGLGLQFLGVAPDDHGPGIGVGIGIHFEEHLVR